MNIKDLENLRKQLDLYEEIVKKKVVSKGKCKVQFCDGTGHINGKSATHSTTGNCPVLKKNRTIAEFIKLVLL